MNNNENSYQNLQSIIKVEPEKFQEIAENFNNRQSLDDILRAKAGVFSEPVVLLDCISIDTLCTPPVLNKLRVKFDQNKTLEDLVREGNEGVHNKKPHICSFCQKVLSTRAYLRRHIEELHLRSTKMSCDLCPKHFTHKASISQHLKRVHGRKRFACNSCDYKTATLAHFQMHQATHEKVVKCPICMKLVTSMKIHKLVHEPKVSCSVCQKMVKKIGLNAHMKLHKKKQKCEICGEAFYWSEELRRHTLKTHFDGEFYDCHCGSVFKCKNTLKNHQKTHNDEKLTCDICQQRFTTKRYLTAHLKKRHSQTHGAFVKMRVLSRNGPFICDKCGLKLPNRRSFLTHIKVHRRGKMFCDLCSKSFRAKFNLTQHLRRIHLGIRPFECNVCGNKSSTKFELKQHMLQHRPETDCKICKKSVTSMIRHLKNHAKVKCSICSKIYSKKSIYKHMKTHNKSRKKR